jgi:shikimate dehydrogenase
VEADLQISGSTRLFAIIGDPISQARTPALFNPLIAKAGRDAVLLPFHVPQAHFAEILPALQKMPNLDGLVLTYPFKEIALQYVDEVTDRATLVGGLNAMRREPDGRWRGDIFDGVGLLAAVRERRDVAGADMLLVGAGGAGRAIAVEFARAGVASITVYDIDAQRGEAIAQRVGAAFPECTTKLGDAVARGHDLIINATPVGMKPSDGLPADLGRLDASMTVIDIVPSETPTPLMRAAEDAGASVVPGKAMTAGQARVILQFFGIL